MHIVFSSNYRGFLGGPSVWFDLWRFSNCRGSNYRVTTVLQKVMTVFVVAQSVRWHFLRSIVDSEGNVRGTVHYRQTRVPTHSSSVLHHKRRVKI